ncbi:MAG: CorA family divalent cation transporter, partial [Bacteroidota bacterium]
MPRRPEVEDSFLTKEIPHKKFTKGIGMIGDVPGSFEIKESSQPPTIEVYSYNEQECIKKLFSSVQEAADHVQQYKALTSWINIEGYGSTTFLKQLQERFELHNLTLEDIVYTSQRPKVEDYDSHLFIISRMLYFTDNILVNEQIGFFIFENVVITIQESYEDCLNPVRERIVGARGRIRQRNAYYLSYALMDAIIDNFFPMIEQIHGRLEKLEEAIMVNPKQAHLNEITKTKKEIIQIRKAILAERDKIAELMRSDYAKKDTKLSLFLRDAYDHCIQIIELIEGEKEIAYSLMDVY